MQVTSVRTLPLLVQPVDDLLILLRRNGHLDLQHKITVEAGGTPELLVELSGPDTLLLTARNGELLLAIEHIAAKLLRLEPEEHDRISFDADRFKADRDHQLQLDAATAVARVTATGRPYSFPPMTSRERRMLHLALQSSGLPTASSGVIPRRFVVLYPMDAGPVQEPATPVPARTDHIRNAFRRR